MHSSCIVVRLDWAAGLPAWLIRSFGSPDLTRKTLFSSQKHQSHGSWDLNEDSWLTLSMNIYQFLDIARRYTPTSGVCTHQTYWQSLARLCYQCHFVVSSLELQSGKCMIIPLMSLLCWDHHHHKLAGKTVLVSAMAKTWRLSVWLTANGLALCEPPLHPDYFEPYTHLAISVYTGPILYQCNAHPVFFSK